MTGALGALLAFLVGSVLRVRRRHVEGSMRRAGVAAPARTASAMYRSLGRGLFELVALWVAPQRMLARVRLPALDDAAPAGGIVLTAHTGNWDLAACAVAQRWRLTVVTKHFSVGALDAIWQGLRRARGVRLVGARGAASAVAAAVRRGEIAAMLMDQVPDQTRAVVTTRFLGEAVAVDLSPALLALRARCPLVVAFPKREVDGGHAIEIAAVFEPPERGTRRWAEATMASATALLEAFVRRHPDQWLWMHRRWRMPAGSAGRAGPLPGFPAGGIGSA